VDVGMLDDFGAVGDGETVNVFEWVNEFNQIFGKGFKQRLKGQLKQNTRNMCLLIKVSDQLAHLSKAKIRREQVNLFHVDIILIDYTFELLVVLLLRDIVLQKLMQLEPDPNSGGKNDLLLDVGQRGIVEADVDNVQFGDGPLGVLGVEGLALLAFGSYLLLYVD
jgi:hypothetical protein